MIKYDRLLSKFIEKGRNQWTEFYHYGKKKE